MACKIIQLNGIKIYDLSYGRTLEQLIQQTSKQGSSLRKNTEYRQRLELIQDFDFPISCSKVQTTNDQQNIIASGIYPPSIKIFDTQELSLKCQRGLDSEIVDFCILGQDYRKLAMICIDRTIELHAQYGRHHKVRVPKTSSRAQYNAFTCDLLIGGMGNELYRLNLDQGAFLTPFTYDTQNIRSICHISHLDLLLVGGETGTIEFTDYRQRNNIGKSVVIDGQAITMIQGNPDTVYYGIGGEKGLVKIFDLRNNNDAVQTIRHPYPLPINGLTFHNGTKTIISTNKKAVRINYLQSGKLFTNFEPTAEINSFHLVPNSGLILIAQERHRIGQYFIPQLDVAPTWCPYVESIAEDNEVENQDTIYDEFKFLTMEQIEEFNCQELIGSKFLKAHLHGYLMHMKLYKKMLKLRKASSYNEYKEAVIKAKLENVQHRPIMINESDDIAINKEFYIEQNEKHGETVKIDQDNRFSGLFKDSRFQIDKKSTDYARTHPSEWAFRKNAESVEESTDLTITERESKSRKKGPSSSGLKYKPHTHVSKGSKRLLLERGEGERNMGKIKKGRKNERAVFRKKLATMIK